MGVLRYKDLLKVYIELAKAVTKPEENPHYPESIRGNGALRAIYDNCGEDEQLALRIHNAVMGARQVGFRTNLTKIRKIKKALFAVLGNQDEVERVYSIVEAQEEYGW